MMLKGGCSDFSPAIMDTKGRLRCVVTARISAGSAIFFDNAAYMGNGRKLTRIDLDGAFTELADYGDLGIINFHHNIDVGKVGIILDADTTTYYNCVNIEVAASATVFNQWHLATIISAAMIAGGCDPSQSVSPTPPDCVYTQSV